MPLTSEPRVLSITWNLIRGGTEGQCARAAMGLAARGHSHRVAVFRSEGFFLEAVETICGPVTAIDIHRMFRPHTFREVRRLADFLITKSIQIVHAWDADAAIFGSLAASIAQVPFITSRRDLGAIYPFHKNHLLRRADRKAAGVVINAEAIRSFVLEEGVPPEKIHLVPNIIDLVEFDRLSAGPCPSAGSLPDGRRIVTVARLDPEKNTALLVRAMPQVLKKHADARLVVAGDGRERAVLEQLARELGVAEQVTFLGEIHDVPALLRRCQIGALVPSSNEGLSNTVLEYLAGGLPVVVTDCGGNRELVSDGVSGHVIKINDLAGLVDALDQLLQNPPKAAGMGRAGRGFVESHFDTGKSLDVLAALYRSVVA